LLATYPGDTKQDEDKRWANRAGHKYYKGHWAGIDCMGFVLRSVAAPDSRLTSVTLPALCYNDSSPCTVGGPLGSEKSISNLSTTSFNSETGKYATEAYSRIANSDKEKALIKKGDLVLYGGHISIVYSERWGESEKKGNYDIIHAYGSTTYRDKQQNKHIFSRKVLITADDLPGKKGKLEPLGFGRMKLWE
jgi:hypothetical protein